MSDDKPSYAIGNWLFLRLLGLVYLIAFVSLWVQIEGLIGTNGILPVADYLERVHEVTGADRYRRLPTLLWFADGDLALHLLCGAGAVLSLLLIAGVAPVPVLGSLWACYLSLTLGGQTFLSFQWDILLLETGFCALFVAPLVLKPRLPGSLSPPPRAGRWLMWLLLWKLMFLSGAVKPLSMDETWWKLTALDYHYWTQPIPNGVSWYAHHLPAWFRKLSTLMTYAIEIVLPFLIFAGRYGRRILAFATVFLMLAISWTGNYGFFNLLTVVLCLPLLDDGLFRRWLPKRDQVTGETAEGRPSKEEEHQGPSVWSRVPRVGATFAVVLLIALSALTTVQELVRTVPPGTEGPAGKAARALDRRFLSWGEPSVLRHTGSFRTINGYGLFRSMTTERPEIVVEGSRDGITWTEYAFKYKPGDPSRRPPFVAPHMPRLDWQMWFAALNPGRAQHWLAGLMRGLLRGTPDVIGLLDEDPFEGDSPRFVRLLYYKYRFAAPAERDEHGVWWTRELTGSLTPPLTLEQLGG